MLKLTAWKTALSVLVALTFASPGFAKCKAVTETLKIDASPQAVFQAIQGYRTSTLHHRQLVSYDGKSAVVDEQLEGVPVLGSVHCTWVEKEVPYQRIDYTMVKSDKFVSGSGSYVIVPNGSDSVTLELSTDVDSGVKIPFAREIGSVAARKDMKLRLQSIKHLSESATRIAQKP
ncbi:MAG: SRPBCC family protein [Candidatus Melainabacteria bacterium]|nr:SRPBCC family protein [Candidatus Melainabacteria bacterium]